MSDLKTLNWRDAIIRDGFTQTGFVEESDGYYPSAEFTFRPVLPEVVEEIEGKREALTRAGHHRKSRGVMAQTIDKYVLTVSFDGAEEQAAMTSSEWRRTRMSLQSAIYNIVLGFAPSDPRVMQKDADDPGNAVDDIDLPPLEEETPAGQLGKS